MKTFTCRWDAIQKCLEPLSSTRQVVILRCLKEAAIRDQRFKKASFIREKEKAIIGFNTGMNKPARKPKKKA